MSQWLDHNTDYINVLIWEIHQYVGTKGVSQLYHLSFDDNKVLKIINWIC